MVRLDVGGICVVHELYNLYFILLYGCKNDVIKNDVVDVSDTMIDRQTTASESFVEFPTRHDYGSTGTRCTGSTAY
jgi:hypothetical protein